jgi:hypothetical protein
MELVAALPWNQWQDSPGIGGIFGVEYAPYSHAAKEDSSKGRSQKLEEKLISIFS